MDLTEMHYHAGGAYTAFARERLPAWALTNEDRFYTPNNVLLGVEMVVDDNGNIASATVNHCVRLGVWLNRVFNLTSDDHYRHYDITGKMCPKPWIDDPYLWSDFKSRIKAAA
jgi:N-acetylmuramoyl-L-alanine amidase CwlA